MEAEKIVNANLLDIIFDGRNKEYGAYELRKTYNMRLIKAIGGMMLVMLLFFIVYSLADRATGIRSRAMVVRDVQLEEVKEEKKNVPPPPLPPKWELSKVEVTRFTPPRIVKDNEVKEEEKPPEQEKLENARIGTMNQEGVRDEGITAAPVSDAGKGVVEAPGAKGIEDDDKIFMKVEIESEYPGGRAAWQRYLNKNLRYPEDALNNGIQGVIIVQFIVDKEGNVSEVQEVSGSNQGGLREEAARVIRKSGKWIPAIQNGRQVKSFKNQPVAFLLAAQ